MYTYRRSNSVSFRLECLGALVATAMVERGNMSTAKQFKDFDFRFNIQTRTRKQKKILVYVHLARDSVKRVVLLARFSEVCSHKKTS